MRDHEAKFKMGKVSAETASEKIDEEDKRALKISALMEAGESLVRELRYQRAPDFSRAVFELYEKDLHDVYMPEIVQARQLMKYLDVVRITQVASPEDPESPATVIDFEFTTLPPDFAECNPEEQEAYQAIAEESTLSVQLNQLNQQQSVISAREFAADDPEEQEINIPTNELRKCIFSILTPKEELPAADNINPLEPNMHATITQIMKDIASWHLAEEAYALTDNAGDEIGYMHMISNNGTLNEMGIYKIINTELGVSAEGDIVDHQRALAATIITEPDKLGIETYYTQGAVGTIGRSEEIVDDTDLSDTEEQQSALQEEQQAMTILLEFMQELTREISGGVDFEPLNENTPHRNRNAGGPNQDSS